jgi:hypothetical protein
MNLIASQPPVLVELNYPHIIGIFELNLMGDSHKRFRAFCPISTPARGMKAKQRQTSDPVTRNILLLISSARFSK